jgi:hypothetical protein
LNDLAQLIHAGILIIRQLEQFLRSGRQRDHIANAQEQTLQRLAAFRG